MKKTGLKSCLRIPLLSLVLLNSIVSHAARVERSGLYAIWYGAKTELLTPHYMFGGQVAVQWAEVETGPGVYDFSVLDSRLQALADLGMAATVQLNGNDKPDYLFDLVPYHPEAFSVQVDDPQGTLMYWHPTYVEAYANLLEAYGNHLKSSPLKEYVLGVRQNFDAIGTELLTVPTDKRDLAQWIVPAGATQGTEFTSSAATQYETRVLQEFVDHFSPDIPVFVRNNIADSLRSTYLDRFNNGDLSWFQTASEMEPRTGAPWHVNQYQTFIDFCRSGKTTAYAESWADSWGVHGSITDPRWCGPSQWNYWRLLLDLHAGVSHVAIYGADLSMAWDGWNSGVYQPQYMGEFAQAFEFTIRYAGYHASPQDSPGAWVALREGNTLKGDYTFLMQRLADSSTGQSLVGPDEQRFGAWCRQLPDQATMRFALNSTFAQSLSANRAEIRVTYYDGAGVGFIMKAGDVEKSVPLQGTNRWRTAIMYVSGDGLQPDSLGAHVSVRALSPLRLHMAEVRRLNATAPSLPETLTRKSSWADSDNASETNSGFNANERNAPNGVWSYRFLPDGGGLTDAKPWFNTPGVQMIWDSVNRYWAHDGAQLVDSAGLQHSGVSVKRYGKVPAAIFEPRQRAHASIAGRLRFEFYKDSAAKTTEWVIARRSRDRCEVLASGSVSVNAGEATNQMVTKYVDLAPSAFPSLQNIPLGEGDALFWSHRMTAKTGSAALKMRDDEMTISLSPDGPSASDSFEQYK